MPTVATVIVAAGEGRRLGAGPKAFVALAGRALFLHSLERLSGVPGLIEQVLVVPAGEKARVEEEFAADLRRLKVSRVVEGGARRQDSAAAGFRAVSAKAEVVLIHDAARPLVLAADAARVAEAAAREGAALLAVPLADTLKREGPKGRVAETLDRRGLWRAATPQGFRRAVYAAALERAGRDGPEATDDAMLVERAGGAVALVEGDPSNLKITTVADLRAAEAILREGPR
jgi:2-C-methyl-D-erythritol 4-phosphate cytidylyltransferase